MPYFTLSRCVTCGTLTAFPRPVPAVLADFHNTAEYFAHPYFTNRRANAVGVQRRCAAIGRRLGAEALRSLPGKKHLDIGCDTGALLKSAADLFGTHPVGIDVAARPIALAREAGIEAYQSDLAGAPHLRGFTLTTIVDVLEHVDDPVGFMHDVASRLEPGGWCYVETPNIASFVYQAGRLLSTMTGGRPTWLCQRLFLPEHVQYISDEGIEHLATHAGLQVQAHGCRSLESQDINTTRLVQLGLAVLQAFDRLRGSELLHWAVLRKPAV